eukprot:4010926-Pyramimonas_sp.AAC.1
MFPTGPKAGRKGPKMRTVREALRTSVFLRTAEELDSFPDSRRSSWTGCGEWSRRCTTGSCSASGGGC